MFVIFNFHPGLKTWFKVFESIFSTLNIIIVNMINTVCVGELSLAISEEKFKYSKCSKIGSNAQFGIIMIFFYAD